MSDPEKTVGEQIFSVEKITALATEFQNEINECLTDFEVMETLTRWISKYGSEIATKLLAEDCVVLDDGVRGYYLKFIPTINTQQRQKSEVVIGETEPSLEDLEVIKAVTERFTEDMIGEVMGFCSELEHRHHPSREAMRMAIGDVFKVAHTMVTQTVLFNDRKERALHPIFWLTLDKLDRMIRAVGGIHDDGKGEIHHEPTLYTQ
jgi:hypothetical protein